jgi:hypothetical protein
MIRFTEGFLPRIADKIKPKTIGPKKAMNKITTNRITVLKRRPTPRKETRERAFDIETGFPKQISEISPISAK